MDWFFHAFDACLLAIAQGACWVEALFLVSTCAPFVAPLFIRCFCCGLTCLVVEDLYGSDLLATNYTTVSGSWTVSGGALHTSSNGALLIHNSALANNYGSAEVVVQVDAVGVTTRLIGAYTDSNNYMYAEGDRTGATTTTWKLYEIIGGAAPVQRGTTINDTTGLNTNLNIILCWTGTFAVLQVGGSVMTTFDATLTGTKAGLGADAAAGEADFDNFRLRSNLDHGGTSAAGCTSCTSNCSDATVSEQLQVDITGVVNASCGTCTNLNTTYILDFINTIPTYSDSLSECAGTYTSIAFSYSGAGSLTISGGEVQSWDVSLSVSTRKDCSAVIGPVSKSPGFNTTCDFSASTATITPL